ncbi:MAG: zinc metalloprotease HtpX [Deltaproteobacteria bacterium]|nr:MAG: zinc metalloprotease HtpX [Deltaproteobacteria bacterium]
MNQVKTYVLMVLLTILLVWIGSLLGGRNGAIFAFILAAAMNFGVYWFSDRIVLRMYRAQEVTEAEAPGLHRMVRELAQVAGLPMPKVYIIPNDAPNAFATGRNPQHAAVAVTSGIMKLLSDDELKGVLGHELSHIRHRDILIGTIAATIAGAISYVAAMARWGAIFGGFGGDDDEGGAANLIAILVLTTLASIAAILIQMAISRSREYYADEGGARLAGNPLYLARALAKLDAGAKRIPMEVNPSTAHMFIVNPLRGGGIQSLFSTHPPIEERIRRLEAMAGR